MASGGRMENTQRAQPGCASPKRILRVLVAESAGNRSLQGMIRRSRGIRHAATEQECMDLAYAAAVDVMLIDLDDAIFLDPEFIGRVRFVSRSAFPILGVASRRPPECGAWFRSGLADLLVREGLTPALLDRTLRHWIKHYRMRRRLHRADRLALQWWKNLVDALDEVRGRLLRHLDSLGAFLSLLDGADGEIPEMRARYLDQARKQMAEMGQITADLEQAARTIRSKGIERSMEENLAGKRVMLPEGWLHSPPDREEAEHRIDPPRTRSSKEGPHGQPF